MALVQMALTVVVVNFVLFGLSTIVVALRCYVRITRKSFGLDDWLLVSGYVFFGGNVAMSTASAANGLGVHHFGATSAEMEAAIKYFTIFQLFTLTGTLPIKASICVTLLRITPDLRYKRILYAIMVGSVLTSLIADIVVFATCRPMAFTWDKTIAGGKCSSLSAIMALSYCFSAMNIITDWSCAIMPVFILWKIQMPPRLKVSVSLVLGMGVVASIATLVRLKTFPAYLNTTDYLYGVAEIVVWSTVEIGLAIIASSLTALRPLLARVWGGFSSDDSPDSKEDRRQYIRSRSIQLRNVKDGTANVTVTGGNPSNPSLDSIPSDEDKTSQRGILTDQQHQQHFNKDGGIVVTQMYKVEGAITKSSNSDRNMKERGFVDMV